MHWYGPSSAGSGEIQVKIPLLTTDLTLDGMLHVGKYGGQCRYCETTVKSNSCGADLCILGRIDLLHI